jgi:hypothetical protein
MFAKAASPTSDIAVAMQMYSSASVLEAFSIGSTHVAKIFSPRDSLELDHACGVAMQGSVVQNSASTGLVLSLGGLCARIDGLSVPSLAKGDRVRVLLT